MRPPLTRHALFRLRPPARSYHNSSFLPIDKSTLSDISSPHWSSEALIPIFDRSTQSIKSFIHAKNKSEHSPHGTRFLEKTPSEALLRAANSVIGASCQVRAGWASARTVSSAFEVGPGGNSQTFDHTDTSISNP